MRDHLEHLLQHVAAGVLQVDQDDIGIDAVDLVEQAGGVLDQHDVGKARLAQAHFQDRAANGVLVDHEYLQRGIWRQAGHWAGALGCVLHTYLAALQHEVQRTLDRAANAPLPLTGRGRGWGIKVLIRTLAFSPHP